MKLMFISSVFACCFLLVTAQSCGPNATVTECESSCDSAYCPTSDAMPLPCNSPSLICNAGCDCIPGFLKYNGQCIRSSDCPPVECTSENEEFDCPYICRGLNERCSAIRNPNRCCTEPPLCSIRTAGCEPRCYCKPGFYRNSDFKCVPADQC